MAPLGQDLLLSELCRICNTNPTKYRCPGCALRTCSLTCAKRHKAWYQCSGVRNPAAYVKSKDLATPSGIDRDFNFLTSIEREFDKADRNAQKRGIVVEEPEKSARGRRKEGVKLRSAIERTGVIVDRAPKGMRREKDNRSRWDGTHNCLFWTVEWIHQDGGKDLMDCLETVPLLEGYAKLRRKNQLQKKQRPQKKKSKYKHDHKSDIQPALDTASISEKNPVVDSATPPTASGTTQPVNEEKVVSVPPASLATKGPAGLINSNSKRPMTDQATTALSDDATAPLTDDLLATSSKDSDGFLGYYFYLFRPHTTSSSRVLIPIPASAPLQDVLRGQIVLEFPTIYALPHPPVALPEGFMLESDYLAQSNAEAAELEELLSKVSAPDLEEGEIDDGETALQDAMDKKRLLDVLKKDVGSAR